jgi:hypothetical protein
MTAREVESRLQCARVAIPGQAPWPRCEMGGNPASGAIEDPRLRVDPEQREFSGYLATFTRVCGLTWRRDRGTPTAIGGSSPEAPLAAILPEYNPCARRRVGLPNTRLGVAAADTGIGAGTSSLAGTRFAKQAG